MAFAPPVVPNVGPTETACFDVTFTGAGSPLGAFDLNFKDDASSAVLGTIPVAVECEEDIKVAIDIKPASCPNPINCRGKGVVPVAIVGTGAFDVSQVDPETVKLAGVSPLRWAYEDVATPVDPVVGKSDCDNDCTPEGADGVVDLTLKFDKKELLDKIGNVDMCMVVGLTGNLLPDFGGTPIVGEDVVRFQCR